jgi:hypothetical protein
MGEGDRGHGEVGRHPQGKQRGKQAADAEAHHSRRSAGEEADREDREEEEDAIDVRFSAAESSLSKPL